MSERKAKRSYTPLPSLSRFWRRCGKNNEPPQFPRFLRGSPVRRDHDRAAVDRAVSEYYGSLSTEEAAEQAEWGELALREFSREERT